MDGYDDSSSENYSSMKQGLEIRIAQLGNSCRFPAMVGDLVSKWTPCYANSLMSVPRLGRFRMWLCLFFSFSSSSSSLPPPLSSLSLAASTTTTAQTVYLTVGGKWALSYSSRRSGTSLTWTRLGVTGGASAAGTGTVDAAIGGGWVVTGPSS